MQTWDTKSQPYAARQATVTIVATNSLLLTTHKGRVTTELCNVLSPIGLAKGL
jgi:hypothetical protein